MNKKILLTTLIAFSAFSANALYINNSYAQQEESNKYINKSILKDFTLNPVYKDIHPNKELTAKLAPIFKIIKTYHYNQPNIRSSQAFAKKALNFYLEALDPGKIYFTSEDKEKFLADYTHGKFPAFLNSLEPAFNIYKIFAHRATDYNQKAVSYIVSLTKPINLDTQHKITLRSYRDFASAAEKEKNLKLEVLLRLIELKIDRPNMTWDELRTRAVRQFLFKQKQINHYKASNILKIFVNDGIAEALDSHSNFYPLEDLQNFRDSLSSSFVGIGVSLKQAEDGLITFTSILEGGPVSQQGGIEKDDSLEAVSQDGKNFTTVDDLSLDDVIKLVKGKIDTPVWLKLVSKEGVHKTSKIIRGTVKSDHNTVKVETFKSDNKEFGVVSFGGFYKGLDTDLRNALDNNPNLEGLIIDLRNNGGGLVTEVLGISDIFLNYLDYVFQTSEQNGSNHQIKWAAPAEFGKSRWTFHYRKPIIVMVNGYSASASEIFAAAIQDYKRGYVIGSKTFGKGTVQSTFPLDIYTNKEDGMLKLTIQKFYRVTGASTQFEGVTPDIILTTDINSDIPNASERSLKNPLPYSEIKPAFHKNLKYQSDVYLQSLLTAKTDYIKTHPEYKYYEEFEKLSYQLQGRKDYKLNYTENFNLIEKAHDLYLTGFNAYAPIIGYKPLKTYKEVKNLLPTQNKYDPDLDMVKHMLVKYVEAYNNK